MTKLIRSKREHPFTIIPNRLILSALSPDAKLIYSILALHADNETGAAWPKYDTLQKESYLHRRDVAQAVRDLMDAGWITKERRFSASSMYVVASEKPFRVLHAEPVISSTVGTNDDAAISSTVGTAISSTVGTAISSNGGTLTIPIGLDPKELYPKVHAPREPAPLPVDASSPPEKKVRAQDNLFNTIAEVTKSNPKLMGGRIAKVASELKKVNATPEQVRQVEAYFRACDFRGVKGESITLSLLISEWDKGIAYRGGKGGCAKAEDAWDVAMRSRMAGVA